MKHVVTLNKQVKFCYLKQLKKRGEIKRFWKYGKLNASWGFYKYESSKFKFLWVVWSIYFQSLSFYFFINYLHSKKIHCVESVRIRSYSGPYFPAFGLNTERYSVSLRIQSECEKMRTRITPNTDTFYAAIVTQNAWYLDQVLTRNVIGVTTSTAT